ncbi:MAG: hypothetical protein CO125_11020 [Hydrogenophilales bacterium CG_4_9_14_3_um_filter_59_35]|nr:MAG: hypothetical protein COW70_13900 [Hydrogenophilales bacterium CG18_big_fil_WC_8_21_14_2_50_58_12]PIY00829.1 MAG: hypothetical protein COZ23_06350 [Hydrogenophilales bacterium CG_4_10_14_3_um_filter_58_23]PJB04707.1 MAG: hypothetical protein CO125_11020 [Hydrogenophilales bacterium CG_4_9_14_3_um_filter_59_35]
MLRQAKSYNIDLSQVLKQRLAGLMHESRRQEWLMENQAVSGACRTYDESAKNPPLNLTARMFHAQTARRQRPFLLPSRKTGPGPER